MAKTNQKGFALVETLLIVVILAGLIGVGAYVWHAQKQTAATLDAASKVAQSSPEKIVKKKATATQTTDNNNYVTIKEWGVRGVYNGKLHINYKISTANPTNTTQPSDANFGSTELEATANSCRLDTEDYHPGGVIRRATADQTVAGEGGDAITAEQYAKVQPDKVKKIGIYYYAFLHEQGVCGPDFDLSSQTQDAVQSLLKTLSLLQ